MGLRQLRVILDQVRRYKNLLGTKVIVDGGEMGNFSSFFINSYLYPNKPIGDGQFDDFTKRFIGLLKLKLGYIFELQLPEFNQRPQGQQQQRF
ncbi:hypothetical protein AYI70_g1188 [Smittium culicis]|uniref:Uncharacterized protein n=1 Tax=Smittium culicis TaxID=133412 RepID=A0A1R1YDM3_9FUNG|nr:hypothetical protein AYI70_g1188 [Smittium culicis]